MDIGLGILIGLVIAGGLYAWMSDDKPAKAVRSIFASSNARGDVHSDDN